MTASPSGADGQSAGRAVVLGASMAGLLAARVLSETYSSVVVLDRDTLDGSAARRGVPQGRHVHGLLARGQQILDELFPGFTEEMIADGVPTGDLGELRWYFEGQRLKPASTGLICVSAARPQLESHVRDRVEALPNVELLSRCDIVGLITTADHSRVTGARVRRHDAAEDETLEADLVIDTSGRGSRMPLWLKELGYEQVAEDRVKIDLTYTTRHYRLSSPDVLNGDMSINPVSSPAHPRGAFLSRIAGENKCVLSLTGVVGDSAPTDPEGFLDFVRSLPVPDIYDVIQDAEPLDEPVSFHYPTSIRRRYERLSRFPEGLLVQGDAVCSFNPVYGQGMTVAALEALTLREHLKRGAPVKAARFFRDISKIIDVPWDISASSDLRFEGVEGKRTLKIRMGNAYMAKLQAAATKDGAITRTFMRVAGLVDPPQQLMSPKMIVRVLRSRG